MKLGINGTGLVQKASIEAVRQDAAQAAEHGFSSYWLAEHPSGGFDALTVLSIVGQAVPDIELGTAIVPTWPRHPSVLAGQAATISNLIGPRLTLGIGLSHQSMMAELGIDFDKPIRHLREYLQVMMPLLGEGKVRAQGQMISAEVKWFKPATHRVPVLVAALGPQALKVCGELADGTTLAWVGPKTIREHIVPRLSEAAGSVGRDTPRVLATLPVCVTDDPDSVRQVVAKNLSNYGQLPSYRAMFDREGVDGPADVAILGSRSEVEDAIGEMANAGVTDFAPTEFCLSPQQREDTRETLVSLL